MVTFAIRPSVPRSFLALPLFATLVACRIGYSTDSEPTHVRAFRSGGSLGDQARGVATGPEGNVAIVGYLAGEAQLFDRRVVAEGTADLFALSLNPDGRLRWLLSSGGTGHAQGNAVAVGPDGRVCGAGVFTASLRVAGTVLESRGESDAVVFCLDRQGELLWTTSFGGPRMAEAASIAVTDDNHVVVVGSFKDTLEVGEFSLLSVGDSDAFLARFDPRGKPVWALRQGDLSVDRGVAVAVADGTLVWSYESLLLPMGSSEVDFGTVLTPALFVSKVDFTGAEEWTRRFVGAGGAASSGLAWQNGGPLVVGVNFFGELSLDGEALLAAAEDWTTLALVELDAMGETRSVQSLGGTGFVRGEALAAAPGGFLVTGAFFDRLTVGSSTLESAGLSDIFVARFEHGGIANWGRRFGGDLGEVGLAVAPGLGRSSWVAGTVVGELSEAPAPAEPNAGDALVLQYLR